MSPFESPSPLDRTALRDRIYAVLRQEIVEGRLAPGAVVRDTEVAARLGASRTPVREALVRLSAEERLENAVGRGFRVPALTRREIEEVHPLIERLEPLALELSPPLTKGRARELAVSLRRLERAGADARRRNALDAEWHRLLIGACPHPRLLRYVEDLRDALRRYELAYLQDQEDMELSIEEHGAIAAAYERGDRAEALELLRRHWHRGKDELLAVLPEEDRS